ncbi:protein hunchback-like [Planococcus citri]|uniref:protein hunchback-like n=1 Tax=Planococcus citri TaxID=170843 RepID=UPI0031F81A6D
MMVVSMLNSCNINAPNGVLNQQNLDTHHWRQSPQTTSPETDQQNCILSYNTHDQRPPSSPVQNGEDNSSYGSETGADNLSPPQETSRSSGSEDLTSNLFPITGSSMLQQCMEYSNSDNESSQASPSSFHDDDSYRGGKGSGSNGKPKVHKCRTCGFTTTNKHEYWAHNAVHMKPEKILRCPECPFTTEYKHHLDFHMWNHQGVKPHKCDKCPYVCVNKSMLKSHLKSHSNVYQYRCANCSYRTKYCHSLKIHLRKYRHEPGMVLDSEGNPNPNPVIDVYGNRRGPKQKSKKHDQHHHHHHQQQHQQQQQQHQQQQSQQQPPIQPAVPQLNAFQSFPPWVNNVFFPENARIPALLPSTIMGTPFAAAAAAAALSDQAKSLATDLTSQDSNDTLNNNLKITNINNNISSSCNNNNNNTIFNHNNNNNNNIIIMSNDKGINTMDTIQREHCSSIKHEACSDDEDMFHSSIDEPCSVSPPPSSNFMLAYDLKRSTSTTPRLPEITTPSPMTVIEDAPLNLTVSSHTITTQETNNTTPVVKNRRKGVAIKLKQRIYATDDEDYPQNLSSSSTKTNVETTSTTSSTTPGSVDEKPQPSSDSETDIVAKLKDKKNFFYCDFCEITFFNQVMFTMHMGYHGYSDPFTCNRCGKKTEDNIAFYAHMISSAHL